MENKSTGSIIVGLIGALLVLALIIFLAFWFFRSVFSFGVTETPVVEIVPEGNGGTGDDAGLEAFVIEDANIRSTGGMVKGDVEVWKTNHGKNFYVEMYDVVISSGSPLKIYYSDSESASGTLLGEGAGNMDGKRFVFSPHPGIAYVVFADEGGKVVGSAKVDLSEEYFEKEVPDIDTSGEVDGA
jgi:hypothetical protein